MAAGCGRLGFDGSPPAVTGDPTPTARLVVGAATADLTLCLGSGVYWITTAPIAAGWQADTLEDRIAALPPGAVLHAGQIASGASCTTVSDLLIGPEQIQIYAYAVTDTRSAGVGTTARMNPTWTRETTPGGVTIWVHRPEAMYRAPSAAAPVLVFFHGWGHSTNVDDSDPYTVDTMPRNSGLLELFGEDIADANPPRAPALVDQPFLVLAPNCVEGGVLGGSTLECWGWASSDVIYDETMAYARSRLPVDNHRIYATGLSSGGEGAFRIAITHPDEIAAVVPIASMGSAPQWFSDHRCDALSVPVWAFHSINDTESSNTVYMNSQTMVDQLNACTPKPAEAAQLDLGDWRFDNQGHAGWLEVYGDTHGKTHGAFTSIYPWLLAHTR